MSKININRTSIRIFTVLVIFLGLVYFNYLKAQSALKDTRPSPLTIDLISFPEKVSAGNTGSFIWEINSSPDLSTPHTTIYWGYESSPSALTKADSPQAVGYPNLSQDYTSGSFALPSSFNLRIGFKQQGRVFFRAYAQVKGDHLWSKEESLEVIK